MLNETDFHAERRLGIGGSDAGVLMGETQWMTPYKLWQSKVDPDYKSQTSEKMAWGSRLEDDNIEGYEKDEGRLVIHRGMQIIHPDFNFIRGHIDGISVSHPNIGGKDILLEAKCRELHSSIDLFEISKLYYWQAIHYMMILRALALIMVPRFNNYMIEECHFSVLFNGCRRRTYVVQYNEEDGKRLLNACVEFWGRYVLNGKPPELEEPREPEPDSDINATIGIVDDVSEFCINKSNIERLKAENEQIKERIEFYMGDKENLIHRGKRLGTFKSTKGHRFDAKAFQTDFPEICKPYIKPTETKPFFKVSK